MAGYTTFLADKAPWLNFLSVINIIIGLHTCFTLFSLTSSPLAVRIYLNTFVLVFTVASWLLISQHAELKTNLGSPLWNSKQTDHTKYKADISDEWSYNLVQAFAIVGLPLSLFLILANNYRLKNGTFLLGTITLVLVALTVTSIGYISRDYRVRIKHYSDAASGNSWRQEVCNIDRKFLEAREFDR